MLPPQEPTRNDKDRVLHWMLRNTGHSKISMIKAVRMATNCGLRDAKEIVERFYADIDYAHQNKHIATPNPEDVDVEAELADLNEMERTWMRE